MIVSYDSLVKAVQKYLQRTDASFLEMMPVFVQLAQQRLARELKILDNTQIVSGLVFSAESFTLQKPSDWVSTTALTMTRERVVFPLEIRTAQFLGQFQGKTEVPLYYADTSVASMVVNPFVVKGGEVFSLQYTSYMIPLGPSNQTNTLIQVLPQLFLYATLLETASFLREDERLQTWAAYYEKMKEAVSSEDIGRIQQFRAGTH